MMYVDIFKRNRYVPKQIYLFLTIAIYQHRNPIQLAGSHISHEGVWYGIYTTKPV